MFYTEDPGLTYDDVLIVPNYSEILPGEASLESQFSRNISLNIPLASSAMDTVTEMQTAIRMSQLGGIGVIHKNMDPKAQSRQIVKVKKFEAGMVTDPITVHAEDTLERVLSLVEKFNFSGFPVLDDARKVVGIITNRDIRFETDLTKKVKEMMTRGDRLVTASADLNHNEIKALLHKNRIEKIPVVSDNRELVGLVTLKDSQKSIDFPNSNKDDQGQLRVAAAIGVGDKELERAELLVKAGVDAIVIDTAHGHSKGVIWMLQEAKKLFSSVDIIAGNVATEAACKELIKNGADAIKVGIGPGSICTTRVVAGVGVPQLQALMDCRTVCLKNKVPFIADGGVKFSGDIVKALATGASTVMLGSLLAGTDEAPGERIVYQGRAYKFYRGMGSLGAMVHGSKDRYGQGGVDEENKLVPEGIEGQVPYRGPLSENIYQLLGGLRSGMGYVGAKNLKDLTERAKFCKISPAGLKESHPHDVSLVKEAPNYRPSV